MEVVVSLSLRQMEHALPRSRRRPNLVTGRLRDCDVLVKGLCKHILLDFGPDLVTGTPDSNPPPLEQEPLDQVVEDGMAI